MKATGFANLELIRDILSNYFPIFTTVFFDEETVKHVCSMLILLQTTRERLLDEALCDRGADVKSLNAGHGGHGQSNQALIEFTGRGKQAVYTHGLSPSPSISDLLSDLG